MKIKLRPTLDATLALAKVGATLSVKCRFADDMQRVRVLIQIVAL